MSNGSIKTPLHYKKPIAFEQTHANQFKIPIPLSSQSTKGFLSSPVTIQAWTSSMVVLPVFVQSPWVRLNPFSACLFTSIILAVGICFVQIDENRLGRIGSLLVGVSGSWLGGCLFWGWLRAYPIWHLPVEAIAMPLALGGFNTRWRIGASFYLSCLLGTAFTDLMMVLTGVMKFWPKVVEAPLTDAPDLLVETAQQLLHPQPIGLLLIAAVLIGLLARAMKQKAESAEQYKSSWLVASAALTTTLWIDGLFLITALIQPQLSGLI